MGKRIIDVVSNFSLWKGDAYRLAVLVAEEQKAMDAEKLDAADMPDAAELVRS